MLLNRKEDGPSALIYMSAAREWTATLTASDHISGLVSLRTSIALVLACFRSREAFIARRELIRQFHFPSQLPNQETNVLQAVDWPRAFGSHVKRSGQRLLVPFGLLWIL
jgi:hypothetical protein